MSAKLMIAEAVKLQFTIAYSESLALKQVERGSQATHSIDWFAPSGILHDECGNVCNGSKPAILWMSREFPLKSQKLLAAAARGVCPAKPSRPANSADSRKSAILEF
ncbi:hypothetical protein AB4Z51_44670 [Bradyrhizobium sp. 2TAF36]|uniref:hypothetical protein n=1 Tax=Bradyrhizobium sp. 2TAF36 TaxID=3233016 RepID=UPI003F930F4A